MYDRGITTVQIFGKEYPISSDQNPEYIQKLADYVDKKMNEIASETETLASGRIAILACLNIADDLMRLKKEKEQLIRIIEERIANITKMIEKKLSE